MADRLLAVSPASLAGQPGPAVALARNVSKPYVRAKSVRKEVRSHACFRMPYVSASNGERLRTTGSLGGHGLWSRLVGSSYANVSLLKQNATGLPPDVND